MISVENLFSNLLTVGILLTLFLLIYLKMSGKTFGEMISDIRDAFADKSEEIYDTTSNTFQNIR